MYVEGKRRGRWVERWPDGTVWESRESGPWTLRLKDGTIWQRPYLRGQKHGRWIERMGDEVTDECLGVREGQYVREKNTGARSGVLS